MKKVIAILLLALAAAALLTGCFGADPKVERAGKKLMESYLSEHYKKARLGACDQLVARPEGTRLEGTPWVHGDFTADDGTKYSYYVNTEDGSIYTAERIGELSAATAEALAEALDLPAGSVVTYTYPIPMPEGKPLHGLLPVSIGDMGQFLAEALHSEDVMLRITAGGPVALSEAEVQALLADLSGVKLEWRQLSEIPAQADAADYDFWDALEDTPVRVETPDYREQPR